MTMLDEAVCSFSTFIQFEKEHSIIGFSQANRKKGLQGKKVRFLSISTVVEDWDILADGHFE